MNVMLDYMKYETSKSEHKLLTEVKLNENKDFFPIDFIHTNVFFKPEESPPADHYKQCKFSAFPCWLDFPYPEVSFICSLWVGSVREMKLTTGTSSQSLMGNVPMTTLNA